MNHFGNLLLDLECPACKAKFKRHLREMRAGNKYRCQRCGTNIEFAGDGAHKTQKALDDLGRSLGKLNLNFKL